MKEGNQGQGGSVTAARETAASHRAGHPDNTQNKYQSSKQVLYASVRRCEESRGGDGGDGTDDSDQTRRARERPPRQQQTR